MDGEGGVMATATQPLDLHPPGDWVSDHIRRTGDFYERDILDEIARRVTGGVLVDVGAMIGNHTVYLAQFVPHTAIHAFEPLVANLALLYRNVARFPRVFVHPLALSDERGRVRMALDDNNFGHARVTDDGPMLTPAMPLDEYAFHDVTLLKVDVEGHEREVLAGARETIERCHPLVLIEDWPGKGYADLLPGYRLAAEWQEMHQTYLYEWAG